MPGIKLTKNGSTKLTARQRAVIEDLFAGELDEQKILEKHKISRRLYDKWLTDVNFTQEFDRRLKLASRQSQLIIARYAAIAAAKLVQLTESQNSETARKACLDVINYLRPSAPGEPIDESPATSDEPDLPPELASRLLAALAENQLAAEPKTV